MTVINLISMYSVMFMRLLVKPLLNIHKFFFPNLSSYHVVLFSVIDPECEGTIFPDVRFMEGSCYWVNVDVGGIFDWSAADGNCRADGGYLATIANVRVQSKLSMLSIVS